MTMFSYHCPLHPYKLCKKEPYENQPYENQPYENQPYENQPCKNQPYNPQLCKQYTCINYKKYNLYCCECVYYIKQHQSTDKCWICDKTNCSYDIWKRINIKLLTEISATSAGNYPNKYCLINGYTLQ